MFTRKSHSAQVGIVLPFFRAAAYIREAIESVLNQQNAPAWRLYLINDGSDEEDFEIAAAFCREYPDWMQMLQHSGCCRRGISASRNLGLQASREEFIAFLDADDVWFPHKLRTQVELLNEHADAILTFGSAQRWYSWNGGADIHIPAAVDGFGSNCLVPGTALLETFLRDEAQTPCTGSVLIRRQAFDRCGVFEDQFWGLYDDQVLYAKLCLSGDIYVSADCMSRYRKHSHSCCSQAAVNGTEEVERARFLSWLETYQEQYCCCAR